MGKPVHDTQVSNGLTIYFLLIIYFLLLWIISDYFRNFADENQNVAGL